MDQDCVILFRRVPGQYWNPLPYSEALASLARGRQWTRGSALEFPTHFDAADGAKINQEREVHKRRWGRWQRFVGAGGSDLYGSVAVICVGEWQ